MDNENKNLDKILKNKIEEKAKSKNSKSNKKTRVILGITALLIGIIAFSIVLILVQSGFADISDPRMDLLVDEQFTQERIRNYILMFIPIPVLVLILIKVIITKDKKESVESND